MTSIHAPAIALVVALALSGCGDDSATTSSGSGGATSSTTSTTSTTDGSGTTTGQGGGGGAPGVGGAGSGGDDPASEACRASCEQTHAVAEELGCPEPDDDCGCDGSFTECVAEADALYRCYAAEASTATCRCDDFDGLSCESICEEEVQAIIDCGDPLPDDCEAIDDAVEALECDSNELSGVCYNLAEDASDMGCGALHVAYAECVAEAVATECVCPEGGGTAECGALCSDDLEVLATCIEGEE